MTEADVGGPWYHGSPRKLEVLAASSTVTLRRDVACAFSHKPTLVSFEDDGRIRHDGSQPGHLHRVAELLQPADVYPHPRSSVGSGIEYLTRRPLRLAYLGPVPIDADERLRPDEVAELLARARGGGRAEG